MLSTPHPVLVADRFPALLDALLDLLTGLTDEDWQRPVHGDWTVKDLAQHLLGDELNILSGKRDGYHETYASINNWEELVAFINHRNENWVQATRRLSPRVIIDLLRENGEQANTHFAGLDPHAMGGPVNWAGPDLAPVWLDVAREFTERWHHQQHIRAAVNKPGATEPYFLAPVLEAFVRALPVTYQTVDAPEGTTVTLIISGESGGLWSVAREGGKWVLYAGRPQAPDAEAAIPDEIAWKLFTRGIDKEEASMYARLSGDIALAEKLLDTVSILA